MKTHRKRVSSKRFFTLACLPLLMLLSACSEAIDRLWLEAPGWSRAALVGQTSLNQPVSMALDSEGGMAFLAFDKEGTIYYPKIITGSRGGEILWERGLDIPMNKPGATQIFWEGDELTFIWIDDQQLFLVSIDPSGKILGTPTLLSGEATVGAFDITTAPEGLQHLWFGGTRRLPGIYAMTIDEVPSEPVLVDPLGINPSVQFDGEGVLHAAWTLFTQGEVNPYLYYASYPDGSFEPERQTMVTGVSIRTDSNLVGPSLGINSKRIYLFWNEEVRSGRRANKGTGMLVSFPINQPEMASEAELVLIPQIQELVYEDPPDSELLIGSQMLLVDGEYPQVSPDEIHVSTTTDQAIALGLRFQMPDLQGYMVSQLGTLSLYEDGPRGYQLLTSTPNASLTPCFSADASGYLYLTWSERAQGGGYWVYFASTAPDIQAALSEITDGDVNRMVWNTTFGLARGAVLALVSAPMWLVLPGLLLVLTTRLRERDGSMVRPASLTIIALALIAFWVAKMATFRVVDIFSFVPFSIWIQVIPPSLNLALQVGIPVGIFLFALLAARLYARLNGEPSPAMFVIAYGAVDSLLTMAVYGEFLANAIF
jgi:hypothetical protein